MSDNGSGGSITSFFLGVTCMSLFGILFDTRWVHIKKDDVVKKAKVMELVSTNQHGFQKKDTVFIIPFNASEDFHKATSSLIKEGKMKIEKDNAILKP